MRLREAYTPPRVELAIIAESPPASGKYFYDDSGKVSEPLFAALMQHVGFKNDPPTTKADGLRRFQAKGWVVVDATYEPVNKLSDLKKTELIKRDYPSLCRDLDSLGRPELVIIKANVCRLLDAVLVRDGFSVLNRGTVVYFPGFGRQAEFHRQFAYVLKRASEYDG
ncbi:hypothetical protein AUC70_10040 [Methyloceanibacter stevinii]|uniref:Uncharacterized protein n=1 Tax=Methyloceanibacter stevinii TaxID=1774970 RepID=A0A1E3VK88_9HYPH|nr:hypothetical protein [Methyloceanibacter stevinii]ODR93938.1 hypothetical protein AUC70_10040 [Methyloceanibacter stevinii]